MTLSDIDELLCSGFMVQTTLIQITELGDISLVEFVSITYTVK